MKRTSSAAMTRSLAALRRWLNDTWISRIALLDWLRQRRRRWLGPRRKPYPKPPAFRPDWLRFEPRWGPDDFTGLGGAPLVGGGLALLGNSLQLPVMAFARGEPPSAVAAPAPAAVEVSATGPLAAAPFQPAWAWPTAGDAAPGGGGGSSGSSLPPATTLPTVQAPAAGDTGLEDWLGRVGALLDGSGAGVRPAPALPPAPVAPGDSGSGGPSTPAATPAAMLPGPTLATPLAGSTAAGSGDLLAPALLGAASPPSARSNPSGSPRLSPRAGPFTQTGPGSEPYQREPARASLSGTPIDQSFPVDVGPANDPMFPTVDLGCPYS